LQEKAPDAPIEYVEDVVSAPTSSIDPFAILAGVLRRWKLITVITLSAFIATYGVIKLKRPLYKSTVEILVFDPQRQIDVAVQKPISPFVDAVGYDAINTEIQVIKSKSVALRVARELGLDTDPEFQSQQSHNLLEDLAERLGFLHFGRTGNKSAQNIGGTEEEKAEKLDQAADALVEKLEISQQHSYIISVSTTSLNPIKAQRLAATIADDYLASQREARQEALQRVTAWLKGRVDNLQSRVFETESSIEKLKTESGIRDSEYSNIREQQLSALSKEIMAARSEVNEKRARLDQARHLSDTNDDFHGMTATPNDIQSIPELVSSQTLLQLRQKQVELGWRVADLQNKPSEQYAHVADLRAELAGINKQINAEVEHVLGNMRNSYDIAVRREQALDADLQRLIAGHDSEAYQKLQQLRHLADADRNLYQNYLSQYNDISERRTLQDASARIISPATLPRWPTSSHRKLYAIGGALGLGGGFVLAFLLEYFRPGVKTGTEVEQSFGRPVLGIIPLMQHQKFRDTPNDRLLHRIVDEPFSYLSEAVCAIRIGVELSNADAKVILCTSALPAEGKSTAAMLLATSSAASGRNTVLLNCDLRQQAVSEACSKRQPGLSEVLMGTAELTDVIDLDPATNTCVISAGSFVPNPADLLMCQRMRDLLTQLRNRFDYIVIDGPPALPVIDALALSTMVDKVLFIVEWNRTSRANISEALKVLRPEAHRIAGIVLNKVDLNQQRGYGYRGGYEYRSGDRYLSNA
jgi:capsular exopolysaccharide synthesis family protein